jgi:hypothetical protein
MAVALAALPALQNLSPDKALEFVETAEKAAVKARSIAHQLAHSASLTEDEEYQGWLPLSIILFQLWTRFLGPQVEFSLQTQIGLANVLNGFGAGIDTTRMQQVLSLVRRSQDPSGQVKPYEAMVQQHQAQAAQVEHWESGPKSNR